MINPFIVGEKIYLRAPESGDEKIYSLSENHPEPREQLFYALPSSQADQLEKIKTRCADPNIILFTICTINPDRPVGLTAFFHIDWIGRVATYYIAIAESENWSRGYGFETTKLMVDYAFSTLNLNRVQLNVYKENLRAVSVYKKIGFKTEGTRRQAMYHRGKYCDFLHMAVLHTEWKQVAAKH